MKKGESYVLAIVGARTFHDELAFQEGILQVIESWGLPSLVVSGGAQGADSMGAKWALENHIPVKIFYPNWKRDGKRAGLLRNSDIVAACDRMLAFPDPVTGRGTQDSIRKATEQGKEVLIFSVPRKKGVLP